MSPAPPARQQDRQVPDVVPLCSRPIWNVMMRVVSGLERERLHVEHQPRMLVITHRDACRRLDEGQLQTLRLGVLDGSLDVTYGLHVLIEFRTVAVPEPPCKRENFVEHRVEDAALPAQAGLPHSRVGAVDAAEQPVEDHHARVRFHRQRRLLPHRVMQAVVERGVGGRVRCLPGPAQIADLARKSLCENHRRGVGREPPGGHQDDPP